MLEYFATYRNGTTQPPTGIIVAEAAQGDFLIWDHRARAWVYDPALAVRYLDDHRNLDKYQNVDRETAERIVPGITGGEKLPDEDSIRWVFQWKGAPPQRDD